MVSKNIIIGIYHYPHVNFFKNAINILKEKGHNVTVILRDRGDLLPIFKEEIPETRYLVIGKHRKNTFDKFIEMIRNDFETLKYLKSINCDIVTGISGVNLTHSALFLGQPSLMFDDDPQDLTTFNLYSKFATKVILPEYTSAKAKNIQKYRGFKELAHLHPMYFKPNPEILVKYNIEPDNFVLIREQAPVSMVYRHSFVGELYNYAKFLKEKGYKIILSLEDKKNAIIYKDIGEVLIEPVADFHSLLYYSAFTLTTGDSLARESVLLGTPSIYTGKRDMPVNDELIRRNFLFKADNNSKISYFLKKVLKKDCKKNLRLRVTNCITNEWEDVTQFIVKQLLNTSSFSKN